MRNTRKILGWLAETGVQQVEVVRWLSVSPSLVCQTIHGRKNSLKVLMRLLELGCPEELLAIPENSNRRGITNESRSKKVLPDHQS